VTVFTDRAEVKRLAKFKLSPGENELTIEAIAFATIDADSVRVEGQGEATVLDVVCQSKVVDRKEIVSSDKVKELKKEIEQLQLEQEELNLKLARSLRQIETLNAFANKISSSQPKNTDESSSSSSSSSNNYSTFLDFLDVYSQKLESFDTKRHSVELQLKETTDKLNVAHSNLNKLQSPHHHHHDSSSSQQMEIVILVESPPLKIDNQVTLLISYVVYNASWTPKYDIRVFSKDKSMIINYFGMIKQSTGEDWNDTKISLSTAVPSLGGKIPELETQNLRYKVNRPVYHAYK
jgi:uncharacterized protein (TIGR02231 family)